MTIDFDSSEYKGMFIDDGMRKLLSFIEQLVKAHNTQQQNLNHRTSELLNALVDIKELKESAAKQAIEIAELRSLIKYIPSRDEIIIPAAKPPLGVSMEWHNTVMKEYKQMKEDIRAFIVDFINYVTNHIDIEIQVAIRGNMPVVGLIQNALLGNEAFKNLKRHMDD